MATIERPAPRKGAVTIVTARSTGRPGDDTTVWLRRFHPAVPDADTLVCFPHAGGSASYFHRLSAELAPDVRVLAVQYPGRQDRINEPLVDDVTVLADRLVPVLAGCTGRLSLFGHSMGSVVAYETARRLRRQGRPLAAVFASGRRAPSCTRDETVHLRDDAGLVAEIRALDGTQSPLLDDPEILGMVLPPVRNDYRAIETYQHQPGDELDCPLFVLIGDRDPRVTVGEALAWRDHTTGPFALRTFPGGHFYLAEQRAAVLGQIRTTLAEPR